MQQLQERLGGPAISGYTAEITADGAILLRPRVEVSVEEAATLILGNRDRDAFLAAIERPPAPNRALRAARRAHERRVRGR